MRENIRIIPTNATDISKIVETDLEEAEWLTMQGHYRYATLSESRKLDEFLEEKRRHEYPMTSLEISLMAPEDRQELCKAIVDCIDQMMQEIELAELENKLVEPERELGQSLEYLNEDLIVDDRKTFLALR